DGARLAELVLEDGRVAYPQIAPEREVLVDLAAEALDRRRDGQEVEVVEDVACVDVRERRAFAAARQVGVAVAALGARAHHQIRLRAHRGGGEHDEPESYGSDGVSVAHSVIHCSIALVSSAVRQTAPPIGIPGHPCGISVPEMPGAFVIFWKR